MYSTASGQRAVPPSIRHLRYESVPDAASFDVTADRILRSVTGQRDKPPLGDLPSYAASDEVTPALGGLDSVDVLVLKRIGEQALRDFDELFQTHEFLESAIDDLGITEEQGIESLEVLDADGYVKLHRTMGTGVASMSGFSLTTPGLDLYASSFIEDYAVIQHSVISELVGGLEQGNDKEIASRADTSRLLVVHILRLLDRQGLLRLSSSSGPTTRYYNVSPKLRRLIR